MSRATQEITMSAFSAASICSCTNPQMTVIQQYMVLAFIHVRDVFNFSLVLSNSTYPEVGHSWSLERNQKQGLACLVMPA